MHARLKKLFTGLCYEHKGDVFLLQVRLDPAQERKHKLACGHLPVDWLLYACE